MSLMPEDVRVVIISRGRSDCLTSHIVFGKYAVLTVPDSEVDDYKKYGLDIVPHPDDVIGLGRLRNWVLDNFKEKVIVMVDDDIDDLYCVAKKTAIRGYSPDDVFLLLYSTAVCANDLGTVLFGFHQVPSPLQYKAYKPFDFVGLIGGVIGVIGREFRFDDTKMFKVDADFCLSVLIKKRILWKDNRFSFKQARNKNKGGNSMFRTSERRKKEIQELKAKWGKYIEFKICKSSERCSIKVKR